MAGCPSSRSEIGAFRLVFDVPQATVRETLEESPRAMIRAHLRRSIGGGLGGPLRSLPQESVCAGEARARKRNAYRSAVRSLTGLPACT